MTNVNTPITQLPPAIGSLTGQELVPIVQGGTTKQVNVKQLWTGSYAATFPAAIEYVIDGGGAAIPSPSVKGYLNVPFAATIQSVSLFADRVGSVVADIWMCNSSSFNAGITAPTSANSITASSPPTISSTTYYTDSSLTGWTTSISSVDVLAFYVASCTAIQRLTISLQLSRTISS